MAHLGTRPWMAWQERAYYGHARMDMVPRGQITPLLRQPGTGEVNGVSFDIDPECEHIWQHDNDLTPRKVLTDDGIEGTLRGYECRACKMYEKRIVHERRGNLPLTLQTQTVRPGLVARVTLTR